ncbi:MAG TPA: DUF72 domain-containing protein [Dehalococcoidia bacterium]|nr:DUF72 domain-containing protein [Dehalococcoidia bacterium]
MTKILVGCCSWADKSLVQESDFYPRGAKTSEERLRYYSSQFPIVEVDSSYYAIPELRTAGQWVERTPSDFTFDIKAFRAFTGHRTPLKALPLHLQTDAQSAAKRAANVYYKNLPQDLRHELWRCFAEALLPLDSAGKLGAVIFQFPPWFYPSRENRDHILHCRSLLPAQFSMAVEFRHHSWLEEKGRERTLAFLRENGLSFVCVDAPQGFKSSLPPLAETTSDAVALVRFHGRNAETWEKSAASSAERFDWYYRDEELEEWLPKVSHLAEHSREVHLLLNTNRFDQGPVNARRLAALLTRHGLSPQPAETDREQGRLEL